MNMQSTRPPLHLDALSTAKALPWPELIDALEHGFTQVCESPPRHQHKFEVPNEQAGSLLLMPAWRVGQYIGVKQVLVIPENGKRGLSVVNASYSLFNATTGQLLALIDGETLTNRRTAAASALASKYLSRADSEHLLIVGTGSLARHLAHAHCAVRPIQKITVWGRNSNKAQSLCSELRQADIANEITYTDSLDLVIPNASIISCATSTIEPLIHGELLTAGTHLDLVGAFKPDMREADSLAVKRSRVFVDTRQGALQESGELVIAAAKGLFNADAIVGELSELCAKTLKGRQTRQEITLFKSVGAALEDLNAAVLAFEQQ
jgi:ornithine cyclodeaminase